VKRANFDKVLPHSIHTFYLCFKKIHLIWGNSSFRPAARESLPATGLPSLEAIQFFNSLAALLQLSTYNSNRMKEIPHYAKPSQAQAWLHSE
jgi:hypothetical protein